MSRAAPSGKDANRPPRFQALGGLYSPAAFRKNMEYLPVLIIWIFFGLVVIAVVAIDFIKI